MPQPIKLRAVITQILEHAPGLRTFVLRPDRPVPRFHPGQFLHLALDPYDPALPWPDSRVFSIASSPEERSELRITVSAVGVFTRRMMELENGTAVWLKLPYGEFSVQFTSAPVVLVAGGTGITPFASLLARPAAVTAPLYVLYGARTPQLLLYRDLLERAAAANPHVMFSLFAEEGDVPGVTHGRLTPTAALAAARSLALRACPPVPDSASPIFYLAGPPSMLKSFQDALTAAGAPPVAVRVDAWE